MMKYKELKALLQKHELTCPTEHLTAGITFSSFGPDNHEVYSWESRTYMISSDNKAFQPNKGGYSIFGSCLDGTDQVLRLDWRMQEEQDVDSGWVVEDCFVVGYLLIECSDLNISEPMLFYSHKEAFDHMLLHLAEKGDVALNQLISEDQCKQGIFQNEQYGVSEDNAWLADQDEDWHWKIQPVHIYGPLNIVFAQYKEPKNGTKFGQNEHVTFSSGHIYKEE